MIFHEQLCFGTALVLLAREGGEAIALEIYLRLWGKRVELNAEFLIDGVCSCGAATVMVNKVCFYGLLLCLSWLLGFELSLVVKTLQGISFKQ
jgi:hypothetical protein